MYKNKDKQREADKIRAKRYRDKVKGVTNTRRDGQGVTVTKADSHIDASDISMVKALHQTISNPERTAQGNIRVSKPGDDDYEPQCETTRAFIEDRAKLDPMRDMKRGKDIKCFSDLPPDVQATINRVSDTNEEKQKRTGIAIRYQHLFPDQYYGTQLERAYMPGEVVKLDGPPPTGKPILQVEGGP